MERFIVVCIEKDIIPSHRILQEIEAATYDLAVNEFVNFCNKNLENLGYAYIDESRMENKFPFLGSGYYLINQELEIIDFLKIQKPYSQISYSEKIFRIDSIRV